MIPSADLGKLPVSESAPSGHDARNSTEYDAMSTEIAKLSSMQGVGSIQWNVVADNAARIIENQSKDIPAATYLAVALGELHGLEGWLAGTRILTDILSNWWDSAFPALKRMRARVNSLDWWHDRAKAFLDRQTIPLEPEMSSALQSVVDELDSVAAERMPDCQPMFDLRDAVRRIPLKEAAPEPPVSPQPGAASSAGSTESAGPASFVPEQAAVSAAPLSAAPSNPAPDQPAPAVSPATAPKDLSQARSALMGAVQPYFNLAFSAGCPRDPFAWRMLYLHIWGNLQALPPEENGTTRVPAPDPERVLALATMLSSGKAEQAARAAALFAPESPFCLDIHSLIHSALRQAGKVFSLAVQVVEQESLAFLLRLEGVENKRFSDGTPFAGPEARQWLKTLSAPSGGPAAGADLSGTLEEVAQLVAEQRIGSALDALDRAAKPLEPDDRLRLSIEAVRLLARRRSYDVAAALAESIEETLNRHQLDAWSPETAVEALVALCGVWSAILAAESRESGAAETPGSRLCMPLQEKAGHKYAELLARLARVRPSAALALSGC